MRIVCAAIFAVSVACAGPKAGSSPPIVVDPGKPKIGNPQAVEAYKKAVDAFVEHDRASDWNPGTCGAVAKAFDEIAAQGALISESSFNAGLAWQRCNDDANAKARFEHAVKADPKNPHARAQL